MENEMSGKVKFNENNGIFQDSRKGEVSMVAFEVFAAKNGNEQAKGYWQAINDLYPIIKHIAMGDVSGYADGILLKGETYHITPKQREKRARELFNHVEQFLELASSLEFIQSHGDHSGANSQDFKPE